VKNNSQIYKGFGSIKLTPSNTVSCILRSRICKKKFMP